MKKLVKSFKNLDKNILFTGIAVVCIIIVGVLILANGNPEQFKFLSKIKILGGMSKETLAQKGVDYINNNILSGQTATVIGASEESGLIKMRISIGGKEFDSYISKDGKLLFPEAIKLEGDTVAANTPNQPSKAAKESIVKTAKAELDAYIVSQCPFGLQMQRVLADIIDSAPSLASNIKVRYIGTVSDGRITAMHGDAEAQENLRQICIREEQASKYWEYVSCYIKAGDTDGCLASTGIDGVKLSSCTSDKNKGLTYAQEDFDLNNKFGVRGSPTLVLNEQVVSEFDFGGRTSEAVKTLICYGSEKQTQDCSKTLNTASAATSFSETYEKSGPVSSGSTGANCAPAS
ncbi:MAG: hypothetical protein HYT35_00250 [Candidatus Staskawiczbacteria bacterium]|nr:hypothetical protein [Candidatus Staskawiczbacteria bacterium]